MGERQDFKEEKRNEQPMVSFNTSNALRDIVRVFFWHKILFADQFSL
jgi:hypothetical protein